MIDHSRRTTSRPRAGANPRSQRSACPNSLRLTCWPSIHSFHDRLRHALSICFSGAKIPCPTKMRLRGGSWPQARVRRPGRRTIGSQIVSKSHASASCLTPWTTSIPLTRVPGSIASPAKGTADAPAVSANVAMHRAAPTARTERGMAGISMRTDYARQRALTTPGGPSSPDLANEAVERDDATR